MNFNRTARHLVIALPLLAAIGLVACSSSDDDEGTDPTATATTTAAATAEVGLTVTDVWARATAGNPDENSAVYMVITNTGTDDRLIAADIDDGLASAVELHETVTNGDQMRMQQVEAWDVLGNGGTLELMQGANHVMLIGLSKQFVEGDTIGLTLHFEHAGDVRVEAPVREGMPNSGSMN